MSAFVYIMVQNMWSFVAEHLKGHPERLSVVKVLLENGLRVKGKNVYCNDIEIPTLRVAKAAKVDRRTVIETVKTIQKSPRLRSIFTEIRSAGLSLKEIAKHLGFGVVEIWVEDPSAAGILAATSSLLAQERISIRQALVDDPELHPEPKLTLIAEKKLPGKLISKFLKIKGVAKVSVYC